MCQKFFLILIQKLKINILIQIWISFLMDPPYLVLIYFVIKLGGKNILITTVMKYNNLLCRAQKIASSFFLILYVSFQAERILVQIESVHTVFLPVCLPKVQKSQIFKSCVQAIPVQSRRIWKVFLKCNFYKLCQNLELVTLYKFPVKCFIWQSS